MKLLLLAPTQANEAVDLLSHFCEQENHFVEVVCDDSHDICRELARSEPQACLVLAQEPKRLQDALKVIREQFTSVTIQTLAVTRNRGLPRNWKEVLLSLFQQSPRPWHPTFAFRYPILYCDPELDQEMPTYAHAPEADDEEQAAFEIDKVIRLLTQAESVHTIAFQYRQALIQYRHLTMDDVTAATLQGSPLAWSLARRDFASWVSLLAHYLSGVDIHHLPWPVPANAEYCYIAQAPSQEMSYAVFTVGQQVSEPIRKILTDCVSTLWPQGAPWKNKFHFSLHASGAAEFVRSLANAHVRLMDKWIKPDFDRIGISVPDPQASRHIDLFMKLWYLPYFNTHRYSLANTIRAYHEGLRSPLPALTPSFRQFVELYKQVETAQAVPESQS